MLSKEYFDNFHLTDRAFEDLAKGSISDEDKILLITHIDACEECMERFIDSVSYDELPQNASDELETKIMKAVHVEKDKKKEKRILIMQFAKLAVAASIMFAILFSGSLTILSKKDDASVKQDNGKMLFMLNDHMQTKKRDENTSDFWKFRDDIKKRIFDFSDMINGVKGDAKNDTK